MRDLCLLCVRQVPQQVTLQTGAVGVPRHSAHGAGPGHERGGLGGGGGDLAGAGVVSRGQLCCCDAGCARG